jgi:hypothetical protein
MLIKIKNLTAGPISLPGPLPRLDGSQEVQVEITPENYDHYRQKIDELVHNHSIDVVELEVPGSGFDNFTFDDDGGRILFNGTQIAPSTGAVGPAGGDLSGTYPNPKVAAVTETNGPTRLAIGAIPDGQAIKRVGGTLVGFPAVGTDEKVGITSADTVPDFLNNKLQAGAGIGLTVISVGGGVEKLQVAVTSPGITAASHQALRQLIHFIDDGPANGFLSGAFREIVGAPFPSSVIWYEDVTKAKKIVSVNYTRNATNQATTIVWRIYDTDGSTVLGTATDTVSYTGPWESNRTRAIA